MLLPYTTHIIIRGWKGFSLSRRKWVWFLWKKKAMCGPSMAILCPFPGEQMANGAVRWCGWSNQRAWHHCFLLSQAWGKNHGHGQFHPAFCPLSWEPCAAGCGGVVSARLPWAFLHVITFFYTMLLLVLLLFVFLVALLFSSKFLSQPIISAFCPPLTRGAEGRGVAA